MKNIVQRFTINLTIFIALLLPVLTYSQGEGIQDTIRLTQSEMDFALLEACYNNDQDSAIQLVKAGADVNTFTEEGVTPLHYACMNQNLELIEFLIRNEANVDKQDNNGFTPLIFAAERNYYYVADVLIYLNADLNSTDYLERTALIVAVENASYSTAELLVDMGAELNHRDADGQTALMKAAIDGETLMVEILVESGAMLMSTDRNNYTALGHAVKHGHLETTRKLIYFGADPHELLSPGINLYDIATINGHSGIKELLSSHNVRSNKRLILSKFFLAINSHFNLEDKLWGIAGGVHEYRTNTNISLGSELRIWAKSVRHKKTDKVYNQYWEYRYNLFLKFGKHFNLYRSKNRDRAGILVFIKPTYSFGSYRGLKNNPEARIGLRPGGGVFYNNKYWGLFMEYNYINYGIPAISAHRMDFGVRINFPLNKHLQ